MEIENASNIDKKLIKKKGKQHKVESRIESKQKNINAEI